MRPVLAKVLDNSLEHSMAFLTLSAPEVFEQAVLPGQFAHLKLPGAPDKLLRRPISIMDADEGAKTLTLGIRPVGEGTRLLCAVRPGDEIDLLAPLGHGFSLGSAKKLWLVGGGVGVAPMLYTAKRFSKQAGVTSFLGFQTAELAYAAEGFAACGETLLCTDDGSAGMHGNVLDAMRAQSGLPDCVMACGPTPMLKAVQAFCLEHRIPGQLSLEQRMGCGFGACLTCACKVQDGGKDSYERVCADGPVFDAERVVL